MGQMLRPFFLHIKRYGLIYLGLAIYTLFYISVAFTHWLDIFFSGAALHAGAIGIDFYQVPRGAWAFWHGGKFTGDPLPDGEQYGKEFFANGNVYHPIFTLVIGSFLMLFQAAQAPYVWLCMKAVLSLFAIGYFYWSFRNSKYISFAIFVVCVNFSIYLELAAWQFQFVVNFFLFFLLISLVKRQNWLWSSSLYWWSLLVKPIGLLFVPAFLFKRQWKLVIVGIVCFLLYTAIFVIRGDGTYYTDNLLANLSTSGTAGPNQIITLSALLHYTTTWPDLLYKALQYGLLAIVVYLSLLKRTRISKAVFLYVVYYLCFYQGVYEYQWSTLAYVIAVCVVTCTEFQTKLARICILLTCLPGCFVLMNLWHIDVKDEGFWGLIPGPTAWIWMVISKLIPLFLLVVAVLYRDIKPTFKQTKAFWLGLLKVNREIELFGNDLPEDSAQQQVTPPSPESLDLLPSPSL